ncbi:hypothetical protein RQP46_007241 [Phenoliferia psychrophenolica]
MHPSTSRTPAPPTPAPPTPLAVINEAVANLSIEERQQLRAYVYAETSRTGGTASHQMVVRWLEWNSEVRATAAAPPGRAGGGAIAGRQQIPMTHSAPVPVPFQLPTLPPQSVPPNTLLARNLLFPPELAGDVGATYAHLQKVLFPPTLNSIPYSSSRNPLAPYPPTILFAHAVELLKHNVLSREQVAVLQLVLTKRQGLITTLRVRIAQLELFQSARTSVGLSPAERERARVEVEIEKEKLARVVAMVADGASQAGGVSSGSGIGSSGSGSEWRRTSVGSSIGIQGSNWPTPIPPQPTHPNRPSPFTSGPEILSAIAASLPSPIASSSTLPTTTSTIPLKRPSSPLPPSRPTKKRTTASNPKPKRLTKKQQADAARHASLGITLPAASLPIPHRSISPHPHLDPTTPSASSTPELSHSALPSPLSSLSPSTTTGSPEPPPLPSRPPQRDHEEARNTRETLQRDLETVTRNFENEIVGKKENRKEGVKLRKGMTMREFVESVEPGETITDDVEQLLLGVCDEFIDSITRAACELAKHRHSETLDPQDLALHLAMKYSIKIPGFDSPPAKSHQGPRRVPSSYKERLAAVKKDQGDAPARGGGRARR